MNLKENKLVSYFYEARVELEKVTWPTRRETLVATALVIAVSIATAVFLGALDFGLNKAFSALIAN